MTDLDSFHSDFTFDAYGKLLNGHHRLAALRVLIPFANVGWAISCAGCYAKFIERTGWEDSDRSRRLWFRDRRPIVPIGPLKRFQGGAFP